MSIKISNLSQIYIIAVFIILALLEIDLTGLVAGLGIGGIIVTLAAQDTAKNLFGGLVIFLDKPFNVGDWIEMDPYEGTIEDITFRTTRIRTFENSLNWYGAYQFLEEQWCKQCFSHLQIPILCR